MHAPQPLACRVVVCCIIAQYPFKKFLNVYDFDNQLNSAGYSDHLLHLLVCKEGKLRGEVGDSPSKRLQGRTESHPAALIAWQPQPQAENVFAGFYCRLPLLSPSQVNY